MYSNNEELMKKLLLGAKKTFDNVSSTMGPRAEKLSLFNKKDRT